MTKHEHVECPGYSSPTRCAREGCFIKTQAHPTSNERYVPSVSQDSIDKVCAGFGTQSEKDAVWNYIRGLQRTIEDLRPMAESWESYEAAQARKAEMGLTDETSRELERLRELQEKALALDDAVAEFGIDKPQYIAEVYQAFHDVLHDGHGSPSVVKTLVEVRAFGTSIDPPSQKALAPRYELPLEWQAREWTEIDSPSSLCGLLGCNRQTPHHHKAAL